MEFHRSHAAKALLVSPRVVEMYVFLNGGDQLLLVSESPQIVHLGFQDFPESLLGIIVDAPSNSGHTLHHFGCILLLTKCLAGVPEPTGIMERRIGTGEL